MRSVSLSTRLAGVLLICLALGQFGLQATLLTRDAEFIASSITNDDTYYYVLTAWNTKELGFVTFDRIHDTNGVQLLWFWIVFLLSLLATTKATLLNVTLLTCFLLNVLCYVPIWKLGRLAGRPALTILLASLWSLMVTDGVYWLGLENSLHAFVLWCVIWQMAEFHAALSDGRKPPLLTVTTLLVLNAMTRVDSAVASSVLYVWCLLALALHRADRRRVEQRWAVEIWRSVLVWTIGGAITFGAYYTMGRSAIPVSALIKLSWVREASPILGEARRLLVFSFPPVLPHRIGAPTAKMFLGVVSLVALLALAWKRACAPGWRCRIVWLTGTSLLSALVVHRTLILISGVRHHEYHIWHQSPAYIFWVLAVAIAACVVADAVAAAGAGVIRRLRKATASTATGERAADVMLVGLSVALIALSVLRFATTSEADPKAMSRLRYRAALWVSENLPADAICASWNAGQLGFYSERPVINLDGLINSIDYYKEVLGGSLPLGDYLRSSGVDYVVDYHDDEFTSTLPVVHEFEPDLLGAPIRVRQVIPPEPTKD